MNSGLRRVQDSVCDYEGANMTAAWCWQAMCGLLYVEPAGIFPSCINNLEMYSIDDLGYLFRRST